MVPLYTTEELQIFINALNDASNKQLYISCEIMHDLLYKEVNKTSVSFLACNIPYNEIPLHINDEIRDKFNTIWFRTCLKVRLKIGR